MTWILWLALLIVAVLIGFSIFWAYESSFFVNELRVIFNNQEEAIQDTAVLYGGLNEFISTLTNEELSAIALSDKAILETYFEKLSSGEIEISTEKLEILTKYFIAKSTVQDTSMLENQNSYKLMLSQFEEVRNYYILLSQRQDRILRVLGTLITVVASVLAFFGFKTVREHLKDLDDKVDRSIKDIKKNGEVSKKELTSHVDAKKNELVDIYNEESGKLEQTHQDNLKLISELVEAAETQFSNIALVSSKHTEIAEALYVVHNALNSAECDKLNDIQRKALPILHQHIESISDQVSNKSKDKETVKKPADEKSEESEFTPKIDAKSENVDDTKITPQYGHAHQKRLKAKKPQDKPMD